MNDLSMGAQSVNFWKIAQQQQVARAGQYVETRDQVPLQIPPAAAKFPARWFRQPLDHFDRAKRDTFLQRYWVSDRHYLPGGPVIVLDCGETNGEDRLPFLDTGIVDILAKATHGLGVVLEHRYYGSSVPVLNLTTDSLRWLNNKQAAADSATFMANVRFEGIDDDLTAPGTPWIYYGGSYAGGRAAHMRILYPDLVFGAIASSAAVHASIVYWEYFEVIRQNAPAGCMRRLEGSIDIIDRVLQVPVLRRPFKRLFGLEDLEHDDDFASVLLDPLRGWQARNWDPATSSTQFDEFCAAIEGDNKNAPIRLGPFELDVGVLNYAEYIKTLVAALCPEGKTVEECFGTYDDSQYQNVSLEEYWRAWIFQVCTEWGLFLTSPPNPARPRIISRLITLPYATRICRQSYPPGEHFTVPPLPDVDGAVNSLGGFDIAADRLAFVDGTADPWVPITTHSWYARPRADTTRRPFKWIIDAVHHWDENGLTNPADEPRRIREIHFDQVQFVKAWLKEFDAVQANCTKHAVREQLADIMRLDLIG
ncbi:peptidase S28 [Auricularia subglabra TFB-10046 SS5]|nr:peptidase S28 [Auricularia subglabra TFB-10046 SS5]